TLAAHVLDQDRQVQQAAAGDVELVLALGAWHDAQGDVGLQLLHQAVAQLPAGDVIAVLTGKGRVVDAEDHVERRFVHLDGRQRDGIVEVGNGVADVDVFQPHNGADIAGRDLVRLVPAQPVDD